MLLRLSPILVRPTGHAVHRAPDAERNQHPGDGAAAGHADRNETIVLGTGVTARKVFISPRDGDT